MASFSPIKIHKFTLNMYIYGLFLLLDLVNAQTSLDRSDTSNTTYYLCLLIPIGVGILFYVLRRWRAHRANKEREWTSVSPIQSTVAAPIQPTTQFPRNFTPVNPIRSAAASGQANISAETFMSQRMTAQENRNREGIYSIPIELDEHTSGFIMTNYPSEYLEGESPPNITHTNPLYSEDSEDIFVFMAVQTRTSPTSLNIPQNNPREVPPPSYSSLY